MDFSCWIATPEKGGHCITTPPTDKIWTPRWIVTPGLYSTLNYDPRSEFYVEFWSQFNVELWPGVIIQRWIVTPGLNSTLNCYPGHNYMLNWNTDQDFLLYCDPGSWFHIELWPRVLIPRWIVTPGLDSTLNCDPMLNCDLGLGSQFNVEFSSGVIIQRRFDPGSLFNVELWPVYISSTRGIATREGVKIQQRDQNSTAKEGHNSTKNPLNNDPGSVFNWGVKILSYTGSYKCFSSKYTFFPTVKCSI